MRARNPTLPDFDTAQVTRPSESPEYFGVDELYLPSNEARSEAIRRLTDLRRQMAGRGKIIAAVELIRRIVKKEKLVVFAYHLEV